MSFSKSSASISNPYGSIKFQDRFSGMRFDSPGKASFFKLLELLKRLSDIADEQNLTNNVDQLNVEGRRDSQQRAFRSGQRNSVLDVPPQLHWAQIRELRQNIVNAVQQAVHNTWADIYPEQARDIMFYIRSIGQKNQISDAEAVELIQAVEQNSASQERVNFTLEGHHYSGAVLRHKPRENVLEETNSQKKLTSSSYQPDSNDPKDPKRNDDTQDVDLEEGTDFTQAEQAISVGGKNAQDSGLVARKLPASELSDQPDSANNSNNLPSHAEKSLPVTSRQVAKVYSEVENPAELVRELRERYNVSQETFARKIKVAFATVNRWENGHSTPRPIAIKSLKQLTKGLGEQGEDLLEKHFPAAYRKRQKKILQVSNL